MVSVPCAGFRSLSVLCLWALLLHQSASLRNLIQYHTLVRWQAIAKLAGISQNCKNYANWVIKMQVSVIYQLPTYLPTDFYDLFDLQDAHIFIFQNVHQISKKVILLKDSHKFLLIIKSIWKYVCLCMYIHSEKYPWWIFTIIYSLTLHLWITEQKTYLEPDSLIVQLDMCSEAFGEVCFLLEWINCACLCTVFQSYSIKFHVASTLQKKKKKKREKFLETVVWEMKWS